MLHTKRLTQITHIFPPKYKFISTTQTQSPNPIYSLLNLCTKPNHLKQIHARFILHGLHQNPTLSSKLIETYANFNLFTLSQQVFDSFSSPSSNLYASFICNLYKFGDFKKTLYVYQEMVLKSMYPDENTYPFVLKACFELLDVISWEKIHVHVMKLGFDVYDLVGDVVDEMNRVISGGVGSVGKVFDETRDGVDVWNSMIFEAFKNGESKKGFEVFERMKMERVGLNSVTVINLLRAGVDLRSLRVGRVVHCVVFMSNLSEDLAVNTALLTMYSKLGRLKDARLLFDKMHERDCVVWNLMISAYSHNGGPIEALELLMVMLRSGIRADMFTALAAISSISELKSLKQGKEMHAHVIRNGSDYQVSVHNSLIDMYCKCGCLVNARKLFDLLRNKTEASWSSIIRGFVSQEQFYDALSLFSKMKVDGYRIDFITVINILPACVSIGALEQVKYLHGVSVKYGLTSFPSVNTAFLASYGKCGCIDMARKLFDEEEFNCKDIIAWNSMINAYSKHGDWVQCFDMYNRLKHSNLKPDQVTFLSVLTACVNSGSVKEGWECFKEMTDRYGCQPNQEHYACMVDLLGRAGQMKEASELIKSMPVNPDARVWGPLLSACKLHPDMKLAESAAEKLITMEPKNAGNYILLSNIYAAAEKWDGVSRIRTFLRDRGLKKTPGISWLEISGKVHEFRVADLSHPQSDDIYSILRILQVETKEVMKRKSGTILVTEFE